MHVLLENHSWLNGSDFLRQDNNHLPITVKLLQPFVEDRKVSASNWNAVVYSHAENGFHLLLEQNYNYDLVMPNSKLKSHYRDKSLIGVKCIQREANYCIQSAQLEKYSEEVEA